MISNRQVIIYPVDGFNSPSAIKGHLLRLLSGDLPKQLIRMVKFNDALHFPGVGPAILSMIDKVLPEGVGMFIDLKIGDVLATVRNTLKRYVPYKPTIVTVSSIVTHKTLSVVRETLPETKIALVDTLTDMSETECTQRFAVHPAEKIRRALTDLGTDGAIDFVVCSPLELQYLRQACGDRWGFIVPGIRSPHMAKDHQERVTSLYDALKLGATYAVVGSQLSKGNPDKEISAEKSQQLTWEEVARYFR